jgi:hypothetical protein
MSEHPPDFVDLVTADDPERARLERAHAALLAAGPPPELPPELRVAPPEPRTAVLPFPRRYRFTAVAAAAMLALGLFGVGYLVGGAGSDQVERRVAMSGSGGAKASLALHRKDDAGNWPMELEVRGLPVLPGGETYELWLTRDGKPVESCGAFLVHDGTTVVPLNAPYALREFSGWIVVRSGTEEPVLATAEI